MPFDEDGILT